jgi:hypothetical protein
MDCDEAADRAFFSQFFSQLEYDSGMLKSTRLAIVQQALADIVERLAEMPETPRVLELQAKASAFDKVVLAWVTEPPTEAARAAMLKSVLDLSVQVIEAGKDES